MALPLAARPHPGWWTGDAARRLAWAALILGLAAAIALLEPLPLAIGVAALVVGIAALARPSLAIPVLLFAIPFGSLPREPDAAADTFTLSATEPLVALLALAWLAHGLHARRIRVRPGWLVASIGIFTALGLASITYAISPTAALKETLKWLELLLVLIVVVDLAPDERQAAWLMGSLFLAGSAEALWGAFQFLTGAGPSGFEVDGVLRAFGHFDQPNPFAGYLSTILPLAVMMTLTARSLPRFRVLSAGAVLALGIGIGLSQSRGAWLGLGVALVVLLLVWGRTSRRLLVPGAWLGVTGLLLAAAGLLPASIVARLAQVVDYFGVFDVRTVELTSENWAIVERMAHWQAGWYMFLDHPWLGVGAGNYAEAYVWYYIGDWVEALGHAHNYYLNTAAELGLVGLAALILLIVTIFRPLVRGVLESGAARSGAAWFWRGVLGGVLGAMVVFSVHNIFDNLLVHGVSIQIGFLLGLGVVARDRLRSLTPEEEMARAVQPYRRR